MGNVMVLLLPFGPLLAGFLLESVSARATVAFFLGVILFVAICGTLAKSTRDIPAPADVADA
jgi:glycopeptide antibiotics resistance protein